MKIGFGCLGYSSHEFWSFSLREWQAAVTGYNRKEYGEQETPMNKQGLARLQERYPDK